MYVMTCYYKLKEGSRDALLTELKDHDLERRFRNEPGNIEYAYLIPVGETDVLRVLEVWEDEDSFEAHKTCEAAEVWGSLRPKYVIERDNRGYHVITN